MTAEVDAPRPPGYLASLARDLSVCVGDDLTLSPIQSQLCRRTGSVGTQEWVSACRRARSDV